MVSDFILKVIVDELLPKSVLDKFSNPLKYVTLINFIKKGIHSSAIYIRAPEIFFRFFLFCLILSLKILHFISFNFITVEFCLKKISQLHPILDDGMRLYIMLAMFAAYEDDKVRIDNGFLPIKNVHQSINNLNYKS